MAESKSKSSTSSSTSSTPDETSTTPRDPDGPETVKAPGEDATAEPLPSDQQPLSPSEEEQKAVAKVNDENTRKIVEDRAKDRDIVHGLPVPQTGHYFLLPSHLKTVNRGEVDLSDRKELPAQVAQVQTREAGLPALVTYRYDDGVELVVEWTEDNARAFHDESERVRNR